MATQDKYDRQLRLWGARGQRALGETTVYLIRATAAGTETLKNLVLPGIGRVVVVDDQVVSPSSATSSNFFTTSTSSEPRAKLALDQLLELNPDVKGNSQHVPEGLASIDDWSSRLKERPALVVASDLEPLLLDRVSDACHTENLSLLAVQSYGLVGMLQLQAPPLALLDPKPSHAPPDLRLSEPFPALEELAKSIDYDSLPDHEHGHVPYPLILYKVQQEWKAAHNNVLPKTFAEKQEFAKMITAHRRKDTELNFQEAQNNAYLSYTPLSIDYDRLQEIQNLTSPTTTCPVLHACLVGLHTWWQKQGHRQPPLQGRIPDMTASTQLYIQLQTVYQQQAQKDWNELRQLISPQVVSDDDLTNFCQNLPHLGLYDAATTRLADRSVPNPSVLEDLQCAEAYEADATLTPLVWYIGLQACRRFYQQHSRYPGSTIVNYEQDVDPLHSMLQSLVPAFQLTFDVDWKKVAQELVRFGNAEVHTIASVVGGVASQEAVKIITGQYVPLSNTYVYNGIVSVADVYRL